MSQLYDHMSNQLNVQEKKIAEMNKKLDNLSVMVSKLIKLLEGGKDATLEKEFKRSYVIKLKKYIVETENGKVTRFSNFEEFKKAVN